jgi:hypothetical protein
MPLEFPSLIVIMIAIFSLKSPLCPSLSSGAALPGQASGGTILVGQALTLSLLQQ